MDLIGWIVAPIALGLIYERATLISEWLIMLTTKAYPADQRCELAEEWIADNRNTRGSTWKLVHAAGVLLGLGIPRLFAHAEGQNGGEIDRRFYDRVLQDVFALKLIIRGRLLLSITVLGAISAGAIVTGLLGILPKVLGLPVTLIASSVGILLLTRFAWQAGSKGRDPE